MPAAGARAAERIADEHVPARGEVAHDPRDGAHHLGDAARVEELGIQVVRGPVIPQVQPEGAETPRLQERGEREYVLRFGAALPAVQQHDEIAVPARRRRVVTEKPHAVAAVDEHVATRREQRAGAPRDEPPARQDARQDRLHMRVLQPRRGRERRLAHAASGPMRMRELPGSDST
jgi:hypothetical protein